MTLVAKKSEGNSATAAENVVAVPRLNNEMFIQSMIASDLVEDTILIDSNTCCVDDLVNNTTSLKSDVAESAIDALVKQKLDEVPSCSIKDEPLSEPRNAQKSSYQQRLRKVPLTGNVEERQMQLQMESSNSDELHVLKAELLRSQIKHQRALEEYEKELHSLREKLLRLQIAHQERINAERFSNPHDTPTMSKVLQSASQTICVLS